MANFKTHISVAATSAFIPCIGLHLSGITVDQTLYLTLIGTIGGILPDIDSENSTSIQVVFNVIGILLALLILFSTLNSLGLILSIAIALLLYLIVNFPLKKILQKFSSHRGTIHSIPMALLIGICFYYIIFLVTQKFYISWLSAILLSYGFFIHLILDELYSVDLSGARLKKSFGTALTLFSKNNLIIYILMYMAIIAIYIMIPDKHRLLEFFKLMISNISQNLYTHLLPKEILIKL
jgi:hypothetical protein